MEHQEPSLRRVGGGGARNYVGHYHWDSMNIVLRTLEHVLNICKGPVKKAMYGPEIFTLLHW